MHLPVRPRDRSVYLRVSLQVPRAARRLASCLACLLGVPRLGSHPSASALNLIFAPASESFLDKNALIRGRSLISARPKGSCIEFLAPVKSRLPESILFRSEMAGPAMAGRPVADSGPSTLAQQHKSWTRSLTLTAPATTTIPYTARTCLPSPHLCPWQSP